MSRIIVVAVIAGLVSGLLVGGFDNIFTVPVIERAIALEENRSADGPASLTGHHEGATPVSPTAQRIGMAVGDGIRGMIWGLFFAWWYGLLLKAAPQWRPVALAATIGILGFWSLSLLPFIKYPFNPPGVGAEDTLLLRQLFQFILFSLSAAGVVAVLVIARRINAMTSVVSERLRGYALTLTAYAAVVAIAVFALPGNPDPVPVPVDLLELFRALTMVGHFLTWGLLAAGVAGFVTWQQRSGTNGSGVQISPVNSGAANN